MDPLSTSPHAGLVSIVGAGPGSPDLLTIRAAARLREADLVLRDILVPDELIASTGTRAELVNVGRLCGAAETQDDRLARILGCLIPAARAGKKVVRLKSGDPMIFARTTEEAQGLLAAGIPFEIIPGITAGLAAANLVGVSLTERHAAPSVLFCTGQTAGGGTDKIEAWASLLAGGTTLVLYMGLKALHAIAPRLRQCLRGEDIRVLAVSQVSTPGQRSVSASLSCIESALESSALPMPVVFILGLQAKPFDERFIKNTLPFSSHA